MEEELISNDTAILAHSKGYKIPHLTKSESFSKGWAADEWIASFNVDSVVESKIHTIIRANPGGEYIAIVVLKLTTQTILQRLLRENHNIHLIASYRKYVATSANGYYYSINNFGGMPQHWVGKFDTFEQAMEAGLKAALNLL